MHRVTIHNAGLCLSVQDFGRKGGLSLGVPEGGGLDREAVMVANALVGNELGAALLETCFGGLAFSASHPVRVALTGTRESMLTIQDHTGASLSVPPYRSVDVEAGRVIALGALKDSFCASIAISGGIDTPLLYQSRSTSPNAMLGGHEGRLLQDGDTLPLGLPVEGLGGEKIVESDALISDSDVFRVVLGPQHDRFTQAAVQTFLSQAYRISPLSDRMGKRLEGPQLEHIDNADIPSDGIVNGAIQVPGNGLPIILLADHQTTGGYTKIATVISADLPSLARMMIGREIRFTEVSVAEAENIARTRTQVVESVLGRLLDAPSMLDLGALYRLGDTT